jgi:hypothetical protein
MNSALTAVIAFAVIFGMAMLGLRLRAALRDHHLSPDTKDAVRLGMGLVATMTALLLGLLVASAKGSYDTQRASLIRMASEIAFLDRVLAIYGPETAETRVLLRRGTENIVSETWRSDKAPADARPNTAPGQALYESIQRLEPKDDVQRSLKAQALSTTVEISRARWLLFAQRDSSIATPLLIIVILWLAFIFLSFGMFAASNKVVIATLFVVALSVSSALFLVLELDQPFNGVIQISSEPMRNVLNQMGH